MAGANLSVVAADCVVCGASFEYEHTGGRHRRFCSPLCKARQKADQTVACKARVLRGERQNLYPAPKPRVLHDHKCECCGAAYAASTGAQGNRFCTSKCRDRWHLAQKAKAVEAKLVPLSCPCCATMFKPRHPLQRYCSRRCEKKVQHCNKNHRRRAVTSTGKVNPYAVFCRDAWTCQSCAKPTPRSARGTYDHNAPELDHVVPISKGGAHSYDNTQCLCRQCNLSKGARLIA